MTTNIQVICRFRPTPPQQQEINMNIYENKTVVIDQNNTFTFDRVFHPGTQAEVFETSAEPIITAVLEGFNGTVVAYGQTASGKTHTMEGTQGDDQGIIKRMVNTLFDQIETSPDYLEFRIKIAVIELYMEKVRDLQNTKNSDLKIREDKQHGTYVQDVTETYIAEQKEIYEVLKQCHQNRQISSTNMNEQSSRSHMIFIMTITSLDTRDQSAKTGKLFLVDLAGSEKVSKTGAEGKTLDEAKGINKSLSSLGQVINALTDNSQHVPYRSSKLTRILQCSFGGNSRTTLIITCSKAQTNIQETLSTLRFGTRAKAIKNKPKINKEHTIEELKQMVADKEKQVLLLQEQLIQYKQGGFDDYDTERIKEIKEDLNNSSVCKISIQQFEMLTENNIKLEQECEMLKQKQFTLQQNELDHQSIVRQKEEELFEKQQEYEELITQLKSDQKHKLQQISSTLSQRMGQISDEDVLNVNCLTQLIDGYVKDKLTSKLKQLNYLYKKHHKDVQNEQLLAFLTDYKADLNIQNDQMEALEEQINTLQIKNKELITTNDIQKQLSETLDKTSQLLEIEKDKNKKLDKQLIKTNKDFQDKCSTLENNLETMLQAVHQVISQKQSWQKHYEVTSKKLQIKEEKIKYLEQEIHRLSEENQKLFVKYDCLKELSKLDQRDSLIDFDDYSFTKKKIQRTIKGGNKNGITTHKYSHSFQIDKENQQNDI